LLAAALWTGFPLIFYDTGAYMPWGLIMPYIAAVTVPGWFAAREGCKRVEVVLSGEGADGLFGGYGV